MREPERHFREGVANYESRECEEAAANLAAALRLYPTPEGHIRRLELRQQMAFAIAVAVPKR